MRNLCTICVLTGLFVLGGCRSSSPPAVKIDKPNCLPAGLSVSDEVSAIIIYNPSHESWTHVRIAVDQTDTTEGFKTTIPILAASESTPIYFHDLVRDDGLRLNPDTYGVKDVTFISDQGSYRRIPCDKAYTHQWIEDLSGGK
jgi:hypothetical protein